MCVCVVKVKLFVHMCLCLPEDSLMPIMYMVVYTCIIIYRPSCVLFDVTCDNIESMGSIPWYKAT